MDAKFSVAVVDSIPVHAQASALPESSAISCASPEQYQRTSISCLPQKASAVLPLNITTIALAVLGLVLMSVFVLLATALASAVILGTLDGAWVLQVAGLWLLILCGFVATMHRRAASKDTERASRVTVEPQQVEGFVDDAAFRLAELAAQPVKIGGALAIERYRFAIKKVGRTAGGI